VINKTLDVLRAHPRWFFFGCLVAGAAVSRLPFLYEPNGNLAIAPYLLTWALAGLVAGLLVPDRPWRWAVAMILAWPVFGISSAPTLLEGLVAQIFMAPLLPIFGVPIFAGAYIGRWATGAQRSKPVQSRPPRNSTPFQWKLLLLAYVLCAAPVVIPLGGEIVIVWSAIVAILSVLFVARLTVRPSRAVVLTVTGTVGAFVTLVVYDSLRGGPNHNLLPFELWIVLILTLLASGISAYLTSWIALHFRNRQAKRNGID